MAIGCMTSINHYYKSSCFTSTIHSPHVWDWKMMVYIAWACENNWKVGVLQYRVSSAPAKKQRSVPLLGFVVFELSMAAILSRWCQYSENSASSSCIMRSSLVSWFWKMGFNPIYCMITKWGSKFLSLRANFCTVLPFPPFFINK